MSNDFKINSINMFINKIENEYEVVNLDILKQEFKLDDGDEGFYKLSLSKKVVEGGFSINENYNRPPVGPINKGLYCSICLQTSPDDHATECDYPENDSLNLTIEGFSNFVLKDPDYSGDYSEIKTKINNKTISQEQLNDILLEENSVMVRDGEINVSENKDVMTNISYLGIYKKRGPRKLAAKTTTTQFLNNIIIYYDKKNRKTSIRISKNGLINLINVPHDFAELNELITELITRIRDSNAVNTEAFKILTNLDQFDIIKQKSYIHSTTAQFNVGNNNSEIDFQELDNLIKPYNSLGEPVSSRYTSLEKTPLGDSIINLGNVRIIEWEYSMGKLTRNLVMSKEYIKVVSIPTNGVKLTSIINKYGTINMTISRCSDTQFRRGLCGNSLSLLKPELFNSFVSTISQLFINESDILLKRSLKVDLDDAKNINTVTGYQPKGSIFRKSRTREIGDKVYKEGTRPDPFSWKGSCPDPNVQVLLPHGVKDGDFWYPACQANSQKNIEIMRDYLKKGFPINVDEALEYNIDGIKDNGSGIIPPGMNIEGALAKVYIDDVLKDVTVQKKLSKKSNKYRVKTQEGDTIDISGTDFIRDSRVFPGLNSFNKERLLSCISTNLKVNNYTLDLEGKIIKNTRSIFNEKLDETIFSQFSTVLTNPMNKEMLTYYNIDRFKRNIYRVTSVPKNSYEFYLFLSPSGNYYITQDFYYLNSDFSGSSTTSIILYGFLSNNETEFKKQYNIVDVVYYGESLKGTNFTERRRILFDIQERILNTVTEEIYIISDFFENIIEGSFELKNSGILVYLADTCCKCITWGEQDLFEDSFSIQILSKNRQSITFGIEGRPFEKINLFNNYTFDKRKIPDDLSTGDYVNIVINRDAKGNIVPTKKIDIIEKTSNYLSYYKTMEIILTKFKPIDIFLFEDPLLWVINGDEFEMKEGLLVSI